MKNLFLLILFAFSLVGAGSAVHARASEKVTIAPALEAPVQLSLTGKDGGSDDDDEDDEETLRASDYAALQLLDPTMIRDVLVIQSALGAK